MRWSIMSRDEQSIMHEGGVPGHVIIILGSKTRLPAFPVSGPSRSGDEVRKGADVEEQSSCPWTRGTPGLLMWTRAARQGLLPD